MWAVSFIIDSWLYNQSFGYTCYFINKCECVEIHLLLGLIFSHKKVEISVKKTLIWVWNISLFLSSRCCHILELKTILKTNFNLLVNLCYVLSASVSLYTFFSTQIHTLLTVLPCWHLLKWKKHLLRWNVWILNSKMHPGMSQRIFPTCT